MLDIHVEQGYPYECSCFDDDVEQLKHINIE